MKKILLCLLLLLLVSFIGSCDKKTHNQLVGTENPPITNPDEPPTNNPTFEEIVNSTTTLNSDLYEIDQVKIVNGVDNSYTIISNGSEFHITPQWWEYYLYFRVKDKNSDNYVWKMVEGENWTISGSTVVLEGLNGYVIWAEPFYSDEPQNCQISISFKELTKSVNLTFISSWQRPPLSWEEQFQIDYDNNNLSDYTITAQFKYSELVSYNRQYFQYGWLELYDLKNKNNWNIYIDGHLKTDYFTIDAQDIDCSDVFDYWDTTPSGGNVVVGHIYGFEVRNGILRFIYFWHYIEYVGNEIITPFNENIHRCDVSINFTIKNKTYTKVQTFRCCN